MRILKTTDQNFKKDFSKITHRGEHLAHGVEETVRKILQAVKKNGDEALINFTQRFDGFRPTQKTLRVSQAEIQSAYRKVKASEIKALKLAAARIRSFHKKIGLRSWQYQKEGVRLGQKVTPLDRAGIYVPGGKAAYPSSVLMNALPAKVAGVGEIVMVTPFPKGEANPHVLVAADIAGVDQIFKVGGAQAIAALAYGTQSIPKVDKIVGPGNIFVALAKRQVFGEVDIDMIAGPSEIVVVSDGKVRADWVAADLLSQAEHDENASSILLTWNPDFIPQVDEAIQKILKTLPRAKIAREALRKGSALILVKDAHEAADLVNAIAPEHLELALAYPKAFLKKVRHAGAIFLGTLTTESFGDYLAGPNHVLPTSGTARFSSPLSTLDFLKFSSVIECSKKAVQRLGPTVVRLAELEGLNAHALAMKLRL